MKFPWSSKIIKYIFLVYELFIISAVSLTSYTENFSVKRSVMTSDQDIMRPALVWVGGSCYRKTQIIYPDLGEREEEIKIHEEFRADARQEARSPDPGYPPGFGPPGFGSDESKSFPGLEKSFYDEGPPVVSDEKRDRFTCSIPVPGTYRSHIIGRGGDIKARLEQETQTRITIPRRNEEGDVVIAGPSKNQVETCRNRILLNIASARRRQAFTHFLSIPLDSEEIQTEATKFKEKVLWMECTGVDESIFMPVGKLHLTLSMLTLVSPGERQKAKEIITRCVEDFIRPWLKSNDVQGLKLKVEGLEIMNDDPSQVDVLYGKVLSPDGNAPILMQEIGSAIARAMNASGFSNEERNLKLHVTLMNTKYREDRSEKTEINGESGFGEGKPRVTFDARKILEKFSDFSFGMIDFKSIHVSQRFSGDGEYYPNSAIINVFPEE